MVDDWLCIPFITTGDVLEVGEKLLVAKGGEGGGPSNGFKAQRGHDHTLILDLKLIADIGLVG